MGESDEHALKAPPTSLQQALMTTCTADLTVPGQIKLTTPSSLSPTPTTVVLRYDPKRWTATVEPVKLSMPDDEGFISKWPNQTIQRILLTATQLNTRGRTNLTFSMR